MNTGDFVWKGQRFPSKQRAMLWEQFWCQSPSVQLAILRARSDGEAELIAAQNLFAIRPDWLDVQDRIKDYIDRAYRASRSGEGYYNVH